MDLRNLRGYQFQYTQGLEPSQIRWGQLNKHPADILEGGDFRNLFFNFLFWDMRKFGGDKKDETPCINPLTGI